MISQILVATRAALYATIGLKISDLFDLSLRWLCSLTITTY